MMNNHYNLLFFVVYSSFTVSYLISDSVSILVTYSVSFVTYLLLVRFLSLDSHFLWAHRLHFHFQTILQQNLLFCRWIRCVSWLIQPEVSCLSGELNLDDAWLRWFILMHPCQFLCTLTVVTGLNSYKVYLSFRFLFIFKHLRNVRNLSGHQRHTHEAPEFYFFLAVSTVWACIVNNHLQSIS